MKLQSLAAAFFALLTLWGCASSAPEGEGQVWEDSSLLPSSHREIPKGETAVISYGFIRSVGTNSVTVDIASPIGEDNASYASELTATGVEKTLAIDELCLILGANGKDIPLSQLKEGAALRIIETPSVMVSIRVLPAADPKSQAAPEPSQNDQSLPDSAS